MDTNCAALPHNSKYPDLAGAAVGGLEERPREDRELAKLGLKQYKFCVHNVELKKICGRWHRWWLSRHDAGCFWRPKASDDWQQVFKEDEKEDEKEDPEPVLNFLELGAERVGSGERKVGSSVGPWQNEGGLEREAGI